MYLKSIIAIKVILYFNGYKMNSSLEHKQIQNNKLKTIYVTCKVGGNVITVGISQNLPAS
jgi:hypothetical protein